VPRRPGRLPSVTGWLLAVAVLGVGVSCDLQAPRQAAPSHKPTPRASPSPTPSPEPVPIPSPTPLPTPAPGPQLSVYITRSDYGDVVATTTPGAACTASATMPDGRRVELGTQTANPQGTVAWGYPPKSPAPLGQGFHSISCSLGGLSGSSFAYFEIGA
jgi:hypothetical protein